jgi:hypothetical protein
MTETRLCPPMNADRNLLFGVLALQNNFIDRRELLAAFNRWTADKNKPLGAILVELGNVDVARRQLLEALVAEHLKQHGGDAKKSLAAVSSNGSVHTDLKQIADTDVHASLTGVATLALATAARDAFANRATSAGGRSPSGMRFTILRAHAKGGLGQVSVALDEELNREVAFKEIQEAYADDEVSRARFLLEAEVTGGLEHPGIVPVYGLGHYGDGRPFYAMRFIKGDSMQAAIERFHGKGSPADEADRQADERLHPVKLTRPIAVCRRKPNGNSSVGRARAQHIPLATIRNCSHYGWFQDNSLKWSHAAGKLRPSPRGLFDMHGNLCEWCHDWHGDYGAESSSDNLAGPVEGLNRVDRGGGWSNVASNCRTAYRGQIRPTYRNMNIGFRLALVPFSPSSGSSP